MGIDVGRKDRISGMVDVKCDFKHRSTMLMFETNHANSVRGGQEIKHESAVICSYASRPNPPKKIKIHKSINLPLKMCESEIH